MIEGEHIPVLSHEVLTYLRCEKGKDYLDCTLGAGGHAAAIARVTCPQGTVTGIDRDGEAVALARRRLEEFGDRVVCIHGNFVEMDSLLAPLGLGPFDGILMDLGFSSVQVDDAQRGFSFSRHGPLDMRMDRGQELTAHEIVNKWPEEEIGRVLREYGEERRWKRISGAIAKARSGGPVETTLGLAEIVQRALPPRGRGQKIHPATRTFQALRIAVNGELEDLEAALPGAVGLLKPEGRLAVISYHSLEDRIVKRTFARYVKGCVCPPDFPECRCGRKPTLRLVSRKIVRPGIEEVESNPRSRSAKMRVCEKLRL